jgi:hypothetical protein
MPSFEICLKRNGWSNMLCRHDKKDHLKRATERFDLHFIAAPSNAFIAYGAMIPASWRIAMHSMRPITLR